MAEDILYESGNDVRKWIEKKTGYNIADYFGESPTKGIFRELEGNRWPEKGSIFDSIGADIASFLIGQDPVTGEIPGPKGDDAINEILSKADWEARGLPNPEDLVMGLVGGGGGAAVKGIQKLLAIAGKIKGGKMIPKQPFRQGMIGKPSPKIQELTKSINPKTGKYWNPRTVKGQQTLKPEDAKYIDKGWEQWEKLSKTIPALRGQKTGGSNIIEKLLPLLLLSQLGEGLEGEAPNIGFPSKQY